MGSLHLLLGGPNLEPRCKLGLDLGHLNDADTVHHEVNLVDSVAHSELTAHLWYHFQEGAERDFLPTIIIPPQLIPSDHLADSATLVHVDYFLPAYLILQGAQNASFSALWLLLLILITF